MCLEWISIALLLITSRFVRRYLLYIQRCVFEIYTYIYMLFLVRKYHLKGVHFRDLQLSYSVLLEINIA